MGRHSSGVFGRENVNLGFWLFVLISDLRGFLLLVFALAIKVAALSVHLLSLVSVLFLFLFFFFGGGGYLYNFLVILFSVSGWHRIV